MRKSHLFVLMSLLLFACDYQTIAKVPPELEIAKNQGQFLPITAKVYLQGQLIKLEVARTAQEQAQGLMYRTSLPSNRGMLFLFNPPRPVAFWMKNTLIPLDMLFIHKGKIKAIATNVPPCKADPCPTYSPGNTDIDMVLELKAGRSKELGIKPGDPIEIEPFKIGDHR